MDAKESNRTLLFQAVQNLNLRLSGFEHQLEMLDKCINMVVLTTAEVELIRGTLQDLEHRIRKIESTLNRKDLNL